MEMSGRFKKLIFSLMKTLTGTDLLAIGFTQKPSLGIALSLIKAHLIRQEPEVALAELKSVLTDPAAFTEHTIYAPLADALVKEAEKETADNQIIRLRETGIPYTIYGGDFIEEGARKQMDVAMRLPITAGGALMPDAHQGYGLPIGGVLATKDAIIPYGVGVDIGCRMCMSVYDIPAGFFLENQASFKRELIAFTRFGAGAGWTKKQKADHAILERDEFRQLDLLQSLIDKAHSQLGTSGGGNHFVEFGVLEVEQQDDLLNVPKGTYLALLTHSGSRGFGATIAGHYTRLAKDLCKLPDEARNLAYLSLDSQAGQEYWMAMNLAGDYASACHEVIHDRITKAIGAQLLARVENHHNFAWKEVHNGEEYIVHRKGATPASKDVLGIIPGSMTAPGFIVRGKGESQAFGSASHGAGRQMSRTQAVKTITGDQLRSTLKDHGVTLIGAGLDEAPMAYKDIHTVMEAQRDLVDVLAKFTPKMVRMAEDGSRED
jgi:tRNA-splicing ligase RtcB